MSKKILLIYDQQCPVCDFYCRRVRMQDANLQLVLVNAREDSEAMAHITALNWDIDQGMVLVVGEQYYYGADAIHALALMSSCAGFFNRFNHWIFSSPRRAKVLYPLLRFGRNMLLKILKRNKINNLNKEDNDKF